MRHFHIIHISTPTKILYIYFKIFPIIVLQNKIFIGHHWAHVFIQKYIHLYKVTKKYLYKKNVSLVKNYTENLSTTTKKSMYK